MIQIDTYRLENTKSTPRGAVTGDLTENGIIIARVHKGANTKHLVPPYTTKFFSEQAKYRFSDYCDCLSFTEVLELLYNE